MPSVDYPHYPIRQGLIQSFQTLKVKKKVIKKEFFFAFSGLVSTNNTNLFFFFFLISLNPPFQIYPPVPNG